MGLKRWLLFWKWREYRRRHEEWLAAKHKMKVEDKNLHYLFIASFFLILSGILVEFFLPFFLQDRQGLDILQIGALLTFGLAIGTLIMSIRFSKIQRKVPLKRGLTYSSFFGFVMSFILYILPNRAGVVVSASSERLRRITFDVSRDDTLHNNTRKDNRRYASTQYVFIESIAVVIGLILAFLFIRYTGFSTSFLVFALLSLPAIIYFNKIKEETRFKPKLHHKLPPIDKKLKVFLFSGVAYHFALAASFVLVVTFLVTDYFAQTVEWIAYLYAGFYIATAVSARVTRTYINRFNLLAMATAGMFILFISAVFVLLSHNVFLLLGAMVLEGIGAGIWIPTFEARYWKLTKPSLRDKVAGYYWGWINFVKVIGPLVGGFLAVALGIFGPFAMKAGITLLIIFLYLQTMAAQKNKGVQ